MTPLCLFFPAQKPQPLTRVPPQLLNDWLSHYHTCPHSFVTGGEDGYVRMQHFDQDYFTAKFF